MSEWILGCNSKYFDIKKAFSLEQTITWRQDISVEMGDIIYFYVPNPYRAILYKCEVIKTSLQNMDMNSRQYVLKPQYHDGVEEYMMLRLVCSYPDTLFTDKELKKFGVTSFQTAINVDARLANYLHKEGKNSMPFSKYFILIAIAAVVFVLGVGFSVAFGRKDDNKDTIISVTEIQSISEVSTSSSNVVSSEITISSKIVPEGNNEREKTEKPNLMKGVTAVPCSWSGDSNESFNSKTKETRLRTWNNDSYEGLIELEPNRKYILTIDSNDQIKYQFGYILYSSQDGDEYVEKNTMNNPGWVKIDNSSEKYDFVIQTDASSYYLGMNFGNEDLNKLTLEEINILKEIILNIEMVVDENDQ